MNGFDDFDTQVTAEEFFEAEQDYHQELAEDQQVYPHDLDGYDFPEFDA